MEGPWMDFQAPSEEGPWADYQGGFERAVERVLKAEGGYANDPNDRGGETKYGISQRAHPDVNIAKLTKEKARDIYKTEYWDKLDADNLPEDVREVAFDAAVNQGVSWAKTALKETGANLEAFVERRRQAYDAIVANDPSQKKFYKGWMNRLDEYAPAGPWTDFKGE